MATIQVPDAHEYVLQLRAALVALQQAICTPDLKAEICSTGCLLMDHMIEVAQFLNSPGASWYGENQRQSKTQCQVFGDTWPLPYDHPLTCCVAGVALAFTRLNVRPPLPDGRVLDPAAEAAVAAYRAWRPGYDEHERVEMAAWRNQRAAAAPPHRTLPHRPDPPSLLMSREHAQGVIAARVEPVAMAVAWYDLAGSHLARGLVDHWLLAEAAQVRADLVEAATCMQAALPATQLHAWEYEQWQHLASAVGHRGLSDALWSLRREDWDTNRIRPVNWLICRIRILDLLQQGGAESDLRGLLEMSWIGLFADPLPPELAVDTPLMRCWHHLLHAVINRDVAAFDQRLAERQDLLAAHWTRGGGVAPLSLLDLGGLALLRTARARGLAPAAVAHPYLPLAVQEW